MSVIRRIVLMCINSTLYLGKDAIMERNVLYSSDPRPKKNNFISKKQLVRSLQSSVSHVRHVEKMVAVCCVACCEL